jgi:hypothetical protein
MELKGDGFKLALPAEWRSYSPKGALGDDEKNTTFLLDPQALVSSQVNVGKLDTLSEKERSSPKAWTEDAMNEIKQRAKEFKVREPGIAEVTIGGRPGAAVTAEFLQEDERTTLYGVAAFTDTQAINLRFRTSAEKFEELKPQFDAIVASLTLE